MQNQEKMGDGVKKSRRKGEKAKDNKVGAMVLLIREHTPKTAPRIAPAPGPKRMAPRDGVWGLIMATITGAGIPEAVAAGILVTVVGKILIHTVPYLDNLQKRKGHNLLRPDCLSR